MTMAREQVELCKVRKGERRREKGGGFEWGEVVGGDCGRKVSGVAQSW